MNSCRNKFVMHRFSKTPYTYIISGMQIEYMQVHASITWLHFSIESMIRGNHEYKAVWEDRIFSSSLKGPLGLSNDEWASLQYFKINIIATPIKQQRLWNNPDHMKELYGEYNFGR